MKTVISPRDLILGVVTRLQILAPVGLILWLLGVQISPLVRLVLVPAVLAILAVDTIAHTAPAGTGYTFRTRTNGGGS
ncbi:hypothetical protein ACGF07_31840 [Kitasatospora sp. NPDC048194]|uniref:hypothetical protein n=1 Tax=Kitasatospora sp. NPDC048194 TaxID=3364045 RepID=UPI00371A6B52